MAKFKLVVFDMAGTTVRDKGNVAGSFVNAFEENELPIPATEVNKVMGWRKKDAIKMLLRQYHPQTEANEETLIETIHSDFIENMIAFYKQDTDLQPLPFAEEVFAQLKASKVAVALNTGFTKSISDVLLQQLQWKEGKQFDAVIASDEVKEGRPHPYMIEKLMFRFGIDDAMLVAKVGDTEVDVQEGRNAGCGLVVGVTTGAYTREALEQYNPDKIIDSLNELPALIL
ncbi:MAG: HAD hydrolase-like protein [Chitinophagaceae bacterium]|nr:HAD hydrolase-like protein [Chitinophagaceae bacterium]